jgi:membrane associated rhomboid family serine protease
MAFLRDPDAGPVISAPLIVWLLICCIVGIELSREFLWSGASDLVFEHYGLVPLHYTGAWIGAHHPGFFALAAPFVSSIFLHGSLLHVGLNSIWLLAFGTIVARRLGTGLFLLFFLICGVIGAATFVAMDWGANDAAIGASGAVSGLMAAAIRMFDRNRPPADVALPLAPIFSRTVVSFSLVWVAVNLVAGLTGLGAGPGVLETIAWQDHLGGYFAGLLLIGPLYRFRHGRFDAGPGEEVTVPVE